MANGFEDFNKRRTEVATGNKRQETRNKRQETRENRPSVDGFFISNLMI